MTIAAAYLTSEGVVLGADSTTTVNTPHGQVGQILNYAQKLFEVGEESRFGICTWGAGKIGNISHRTLVARLSDKIDQNSTSVLEATEKFRDIVAAEYGDGGRTGFVGYCLGGGNKDTRVPECHCIIFQPNKKPVLSSLDIGQAVFFGYPEFFARVFYGYDTNLKTNLIKNLKKQISQKDYEQLEKVFDNVFQEAVAPLAAIGFQDLPIREAIDFIHTYLHITIKAFKFRFGPPVCGGPIEVAFISTDRSFRWVCHKSFERAIYEQEF